MGTLFVSCLKFQRRECERTIILDNTLVIILVSAAVILDFKMWKIPNWLVLLGLDTGIFITIQKMGLQQGLANAAVGVLLPILLLYLLFLFGFLGAGDIKLLAAVGAFVGAEIARIMLYAFIFGGILSICYIGKNIRRLKRNGLVSSESGKTGFIFHWQFYWGVWCAFSDDAHDTMKNVKCRK